MDGGGFPGAVDRQQKLQILGPQSLAWRAFSRLKEAKVACLGDLGSSFQLCICYFREKQLYASTKRRKGGRSLTLVVNHLSNWPCWVLTELCRRPSPFLENQLAQAQYWENHPYVISALESKSLSEVSELTEGTLKVRN